MPPPSVSCPHCGRAVFKHSLKFHIAACARKQAAMMVPCPACGSEVPNAELNQHMSTCRAAQQRFAGSGGFRRGSRASSGSLSERGDAVSGRAASAASGKPGHPMSIQPADSDGRVPCGRCGRKFAPDRIATHQFICMGLKHGPANAATAPRPSPSHIAGATVSRAGRPRRASGNAGQWRQQSEELRDAIRAARGAPPLRVAGGSGGVGATDAYGAGARGAERFEPCPHCGRTFASGSWERHVDKCEEITPSPPCLAITQPLASPQVQPVLSFAHPRREDHPPPRATPPASHATRGLSRSCACRPRSRAAASE